MNSKLVAHVVHRFDIGGMEKVLSDTVVGLSNSCRHVIIALTTASSSMMEHLPPNVEVVELGKPASGNDLRVWLRFYKIVRRLKPDVLHTYNLAALEFQFLGLLAGIPTRVHAEHGRDISDPQGTNKKYIIFRKVVGLCIQRWIVVSGDLSAWLRNIVGIKGDKITYIPNGVDTESFTYRGSTRRLHSEPGFLEGFAESDNFIVGTVGRLDPIKNQHSLIECCELIKEKDCDVFESLIVAIVGDGELRKDLHTAIVEKGLLDKVWLPGSRTEINKLLNDLDLFILPSLAEGMPMTVLEAMSVGVPVIASDVGGISELVESDSALLIPPSDTSALADSIIACYRNRSLMQNMSKASRERIEKNFSRSDMLLNYKNIYQL